MKYFVQYLQQSAINDNLITVCGDRGVLILDGRNNLSTMIDDARENNGHRRPLFPSFEIWKGPAFYNAIMVYSYTKKG